jgi:hypothetical protein
MASTERSQPQRRPVVEQIGAQLQRGVIAGREAAGRIAKHINNLSAPLEDRPATAGKQLTPDEAGFNLYGGIGDLTAPIGLNTNPHLLPQMTEGFQPNDIKRPAQELTDGGAAAPIVPGH